MLYQFLPRLSDDEYQTLEASIREHGVQVPVILDENGSVIDGYHRKEIAERLGIEYPKRVKVGLSEELKRTLAISLNVDRRHLTREQKRKLIAASITADPQMSDREHARRTGSTHPTVAAVRTEVEDAGRVESFTTRVSADGRERPATQPVRPAPKPVVVTEEDSLDYDAKQIATRVSDALQTLRAFRTPEHRERVLSKWWPHALKNEEVPPWGLDLFKPEPIRQIAQALTSLANELEGLK